MSYDLGFHWPIDTPYTAFDEDTGEPYTVDKDGFYFMDPTYNIGPIVRWSWPDWCSDLHVSWIDALGNARECLDCIASAKKLGGSSWAELKALEPSNGWGSIDTVVKVMERIIEEAQNVPKEVRAKAYLAARYQ